MSPEHSTPQACGDLDIERIAADLYVAAFPPGNRPSMGWEKLPEIMRAFWLRRTVVTCEAVWAEAYAAGYAAALAGSNGDAAELSPAHAEP